jgi:hypothetical protein
MIGHSTYLLGGLERFVSSIFDQMMTVSKVIIFCQHQTKGFQEIV